MGKDATIPESHKAPMLHASIYPDSSLEPTAAAFRTKEVSELAWEYVATTLIDEYSVRHASGSMSKGRKNKNGKSKTKTPSPDWR